MNSFISSFFGSLSASVGPLINSQSAVGDTFNSFSSNASYSNGNGGVIQGQAATPAH